MRSVSLGLIALGCAAALGGSFVEHPAAGLLTGLAAAVVPAALIAMRARRTQAVRAVAGALVAGTIAAAIVLAYLPPLRAADPSDPLPFPLSLVVVLAGLWLLPLGFTSWLHAKSFSNGETPRPDEDRSR